MKALETDLCQHEQSMPTSAEEPSQDKGKGPSLEDDILNLGPHYASGSGSYQDDSLALCSVFRSFSQAKIPTPRRDTEEMLGHLINAVQHLAENAVSQQREVFALRSFIAIQSETLQDQHDKVIARIDDQAELPPSRKRF